MRFLVVLKRRRIEASTNFIIQKCSFLHGLSFENATHVTGDSGRGHLSICFDGWLSSSVENYLLLPSS